MQVHCGVNIGGRGTLNFQHSADWCSHYYAESLVHRQVGGESVNEVAPIGTYGRAPYGHAELLILLQQVVTIGASQFGNGPVKVTNLLVLVNIADYHLVGAVVGCHATIARCVGGRCGKINRFSTEGTGYNEAELLYGTTAAGVVSCGDNTAPKSQGAPGFLQTGVDCLLALLSREQSGRKYGVGEYGSHYHEGNQDNGGLKPGDTRLVILHPLYQSSEHDIPPNLEIRYFQSTLCGCSITTRAAPI